MTTESNFETTKQSVLDWADFSAANDSAVDLAGFVMITPEAIVATERNERIELVRTAIQVALLEGAEAAETEMIKLIEERATAYGALGMGVPSFGALLKRARLASGEIVEDTTVIGPAELAIASTPGTHSDLFREARDQLAERVLAANEGRITDNVANRAATLLLEGRLKGADPKFLVVDSGNKVTFRRGTVAEYTKDITSYYRSAGPTTAAAVVRFALTLTEEDPTDQ